jgi:RNA polymerase sigma factor (sigma-70 family)
VNEEQLIKELAAGGNRQSLALRRLYMDKGKEFGRFFVGKGLDRVDADDVLQETFLKILKQAPNYRGEGVSTNHANAWMWQIARNALADHFRHKPAEEGLDDDGWRSLEDANPKNTSAPNPLWSCDGPDPSREAEDCVQRGLKLFAAKDPERAFALELLVEGVAGTEIADRIGRSYTATRQYLTECRKALAPFIKDCLQLLPA